MSTITHITRDDLDRELGHMRDLHTERMTSLDGRIREIQNQLQSMANDIKGVQGELVGIRSDAKWYRRIAGGIFALGNALAVAWLKGFFG